MKNKKIEIENEQYWSKVFADNKISEYTEDGLDYNPHLTREIFLRIIAEHQKLNVISKNF
jgi:hypothetical protein